MWLLRWGKGLVRITPRSSSFYVGGFSSSPKSGGVISDSRMSPDLPRGMGKSIGGDLDVDDEGSEQRRFKPVQSLHHGSVGYQLVHT
jgi:hypothetical protein